MLLSLSTTTTLAAKVHKAGMLVRDLPLQCLQIAEAVFFSSFLFA